MLEEDIASSKMQIIEVLTEKQITTLVLVKHNVKSDKSVVIYPLVNTL